MRIYDIQTAFARGELSPRLHARTDIDHYRLSLKECTNWYVLRQGALRKRPGTQFIAEVRDSAAKTRLVPFTFSTEQAYVLEFGDEYFRVFANGGTITEGAQAMSAATQANPVVVTVTGHGYANGDRVLIAGTGGMTELNNREFTIANQSTNAFELSGIDGTGFTTYTSGGTVSRIVEVATPYATADLTGLKFAQSADTLYVAHANYAPIKITRSSDTAWTVTEMVFLDGPYLQQPTTATSLTLSADGNVIPDMTSNSTPSGNATASQGAGTSWNCMDRRIITTFSQTDNGAGWIEYDAGSPKTVVGYTIRPNSAGTGYPSDFVFQGFDGVDWITLDARLGEIFGGSELKSFEFKNTTSYDKYRLKWTDNEGGGSTTRISELGFTESPVTMADITMTASAVTDINEGQGFLATDVGRPVRFRGSDGIWRWFSITAHTSATVVDGKLYGQHMPDLEPTATWRMGAWSVETGYPGSVTFFEERLVWARTNTEPQKVWGSKTFGFDDHGVSTPLVDDDAFSIEIASDQVNEIKWISEASDLLIGTSNAIRTLGPSDTSKAFSATNVRQRRHTTVGSSALQPARIGSVALYADQFAKSLRELFFSFENNAFTAPELTILSDHLLASGIVDLAFAESPDSILWIALASGDLVSLTFERDQRIVGMARHLLAGGAADVQGSVESIATIPGPLASEVWLVVRRTIGGIVRRYVERLSTPFEGMTIEDATFLDGFLQAKGMPGSYVAGLNHLEGETVAVFADGTVQADQTVSGGRVTLSGGQMASTITVGLRYESKIKQLRPPLTAQNGSHLGRLKSVPEVFVDVHETLGLKVGADGAEAELLGRAAGEPMDQQIPLRTGSFKMHFPGGWRSSAEVSILSEQPLPATIRAITRGLEVEP